MAKILPAGANVNLGLGEDPMDRLVKTVDLVMKVGGAFQKSQDRRRTNSSNEMSDLLTMLTNGSQYLSGDDYQKIGNQIKNATSNARSIGSPTLTTQADLLENVHESMSQSNTEYENSLLTFNNDFMNIDIFNQANYTNADGKTVNMAFLEDINERGIDWFNDTQAQLSNYQRQLFTVGAKGELIPKRNNQASRKAQADYQKAQNMFYNLYDSQLNGKISEAEFMYIANKGGLSNQELDAFRADIITNTTSRLNSLERSIVSNNKVTNSLKIKKTDKLRIALNDMEGGEVAFFQEYLAQNKDTTKDELDNIVDNFTPEDFDDNIYIDPNTGDPEEMPEKIRRVYDELISQTDATSLALNTEYDQLKDRFDYWSPFTWDSKNSAGIVDPGSGAGKVIFKDDVVDEDGDGIPDYIQRPAEEEAPAAEEAPAEKVVPVELENKEDFVKLGIDISGNLTKKDLDRIQKELMEALNNTPDSNFVKIQSITSANFAISNALGQAQPVAGIETTQQPALNEQQLNQAKPKFEKFQKQTKNQIALITREINSKKKQMNQMTSFNKESLKKQKDIIAKEIKTLESRLLEQQNILKDTDINTWLNTIADKNTVKQIKTGKSDSELVQDYWRNK